MSGGASQISNTHTLNGSAQLQDQWPTGGPTTDIAAC